MLIKDIEPIMCPWKESWKVSLMALLIKDIQKRRLEHNAVEGSGYFTQEGCFVLQNARLPSKYAIIGIWSPIHQECFRKCEFCIMKQLQLLHQVTRKSWVGPRENE